MAYQVVKAISEMAYERERLEALRRYKILGTAPEPAFDDLASLAAKSCGAPIALIGFVDEQRFWFKSRVGWEIAEITHGDFFCTPAVTQSELLLVEDATLDERFAGNRYVMAAPGIRFYAGIPLTNPQGYVLGTLCVLDTRPRPFLPEQSDALKTLARQVVTQLELRLHVEELEREIAERQRTELALRKAEEKYRGIYENVMEGIYQTAPEGRYLSVNPMLARIYEYDSDVELMTTINDISDQIYVDPLKREEFVRIMQERGIVSNFEAQVYTKHRRIIWISENARAVFNDKGAIEYFEGTVQDITQRKQVEFALRNSEILYHSLVESLPQNIFRKDITERFTFVNQKFCETLRRTQEEILGKTDFDFFPPELATKYQRDDRRLMETGQSFETIEAHLTPKHEKIFVQVVKTPLFDAQGKVVGIQGIFWDVTERKRIEEQLAFERDLLRALLDNVPDRVFFKDTDCRFLKCSMALARRLGIEDPELVVGKTDFDFHPEELAREYFQDEQRIILTGQPMINKIEKQASAGGHEIWASVTKVPLRNRAGHVTGIIGISRDITALKHAEQELALARDAALETARLKSEFLATMSHEIRTPMNAIIGMTGLLLETELSSEQRDFSETVRSSADALLNIINDILDFSKIEAGKLILEKIDFNLREVVESTVELLAQRAQDKGIELASIVMEDVPIDLRGDPGRMRQVLINLVGNAVKFTEAGEVVVRVEKTGDTDTQVDLKFTVTDTGIGIGEEVRGKIFQAFTQADGSTTRKYGGTGLGLAISKQLSELMGGALGVDSRLGEGSSFWFTLSLEKQPWPSAGIRPGAANLIGLRVLIVDDNATNRQILQLQTKAWKMTNCSVASGPEALELLRREHSQGTPLSVAILDYQMPEMDGMTLARRIKTDPTFGSPRLIMLTSLGHRLEQRVLDEAGLSAYLIKPVKQSRLFDTLVNVVTGNVPAGMAANLIAPANLKDGEAIPAPKKHLRILVAEDNMVNQKVTLLQLRKLGYHADTTVNGMEVIEALTHIPYDVVLMDCHMPEMDGYQTAREIRQREQHHRLIEAEGHRIYIIAMTANALDGDREECLASGMDDYITKPVQIEELGAALCRVPTQAAPEGKATVTVATVESLDLSVIASLRELREPGQPDPVAELIDLFLRDAPDKVQQVTTGVEAGDASRLHAGAHSLKGSASNLGARVLAAICAQLDQKARAGKLEGTGELVKQLLEEYEKVRQILIIEKEK